MVRHGEGQDSLLGIGPYANLITPGLSFLSPELADCRMNEAAARDS